VPCRQNRHLLRGCSLAAITAASSESFVAVR
jgi:hypothetical protein